MIGILDTSEIRGEMLRLFDEGNSQKEIAFFCLIQQVAQNPKRYADSTRGDLMLRKIADDFKTIQQRVQDFLLHNTGER